MNSQAILLMVAAMAVFAISDAAIKGASSTLPMGQIFTLVSLGSLFVFLPVLQRRGERLFSADVWNRAVVIRTLGEVFGSAGYIMALTLVPLTTASALMQAQPLALTFSAWLFLSERVGWRRWMAVGVGCIGVLIILRPGYEGFDANALWLLLGIAGLTARDLGTRMLPPHISTPFVATWALLLGTVLGLFLTMMTGAWVMPSGQTWLLLAGASAAVCVAFVVITLSLRLGEMSAIAPFRYTRIVFATLLAIAFFGEWPDAATWIGTAIIIGSGLYAFWREKRRAT